jgi:hypothetical protein
MTTKTKTTKSKATKKKAPIRRLAKRKAGTMTALDAAATVLVESGQAMTTKEMIAAMMAKKYWSSPNGKTPHATLYSSILRELATKGKDARFKKTDRGKFAAAG